MVLRVTRALPALQELLVLKARLDRVYQDTMVKMDMIAGLDQSARLVQQGQLVTLGHRGLQVRVFRAWTGMMQNIPGPVLMTTSQLN